MLTRMFGPKLNTVFASRWKAVWWSAGILMTAYCTVPSAEQTAHNEETKAAASAPHKSPWDKG
jgi:hypothetical protein